MWTTSASSNIIAINYFHHHNDPQHFILAFAECGPQVQVPLKEGDAALHRDQRRGGGQHGGDDGDDDLVIIVMMAMN